MSTEQNQGLSLYEAAREVGVTFEKEWKPESKSVQVNNMNFSYLEWGNPSNPVMVLLHGFAPVSYTHLTLPTILLV